MNHIDATDKLTFKVHFLQSIEKCWHYKSIFPYIYDWLDSVCFLFDNCRSLAQKISPPHFFLAWQHWLRYIYIYIKKNSFGKQVDITGT